VHIDANLSVSVSPLAPSLPPRSIARHRLETGCLSVKHHGEQGRRVDRVESIKDSSISKRRRSLLLLAQRFFVFPFIVKGLERQKHLARCSRLATFSSHGFRRSIGENTDRFPKRDACGGLAVLIERLRRGETKGPRFVAARSLGRAYPPL